MEAALLSPISINHNSNDIRYAPIASVQDILFLSGIFLFGADCFHGFLFFSILWSVRLDCGRTATSRFDRVVSVSTSMATVCSDCRIMWPRLFVNILLKFPFLCRLRTKTSDSWSRWKTWRRSDSIDWVNSKSFRALYRLASIDATVIGFLERCVSRKVVFHLFCFVGVLTPVRKTLCSIYTWLTLGSLLISQLLL